MKMEKTAALFSASLSFFFLGYLLVVHPALADGADIHIGFIDIQKAVSGTQEFKKEFNAFKGDFEKEKSVITDREKKIKQKLEELNKQSFVLNPDLKRTKEEEFRKEKVDFERYVQDRNDEYTRREKEITEKILKKMADVVQKLGKDKNYTMILEQKMAIYTSKNDDLTDAAIKAYDKGGN